MRVIALVACVKTKRHHPTLAQDLYTSPLFVGMRDYAEAHATEWYILSALHGLLHPRAIVGPYNATLAQLTAAGRRTWAAGVGAAFEQLLDRGAPVAGVLILAGKLYRAPIVAALERRGVHYSIPFEGLGLGRQLSALQALRARR